MDLIQPGPGDRDGKSRGAARVRRILPCVGRECDCGPILTPEDNKIVGANAVAVISYGFWKRRFARDIPLSEDEAR